jgi:hypothetical protein
MTTATIPAPPDLARAKRARWLRRFFLVGLALFLLAGALNVFGVRSAEASARGGGYELTVTYPKSARPGLAVPWSFELRKEGGFEPDETIAVRTESAYFDLFDENGFSPTPEAETTDGRYAYWEFKAPPEGRDVLTVGYDTRVEPAAQNGKSGSVAVLDDDGDVVVEVRFRTRIWP